MTQGSKVPCVVLAGGQSRRMGGGAKFLQEMGGRTLLDHIVARLRPQVGELVINSNIPLPDMDLPVLADVIPGHPGPLAGILTGLEYFAGSAVAGGGATHMLSVPADAPFLPHDLVARLGGAVGGHPRTIVMAYSADRIHPVVGLWPLALAADLRMALVEENLRKILVFAERYNLNSVRWSDDEGDPFFNVNRPEDLEAARERLARS
jgi:molybdopterin-guanine dinucleotide biosynthesis protein A